jgi:iron complex outermembrane receptor protein
LPGLAAGLALVMAWGARAVEPVVLPDLVVTAAPDDGLRTGDVLLEEITGHVSRIPRRAFASRTTDLGRVLATQAGVQVRRSGGLGSFSTATLRGASAQQVQVLLDGLPLNGAYGGLANLGEIALGQVRDVSIYRGSVPIQFARGGIGGAVDIRTLRAGDAPRTEVTAGGGSFGTGRGSLLHLGRHAGADVLLSGEFFHTDNDFPFVNDNGTAFNPKDDFRDRRRNAWIDQGSALLKLGGETGVGRRVDGLLEFLLREEGLPARNNSPGTRAALRTRDLGGQLRYTADGLGDGLWNATARLFAGRRDERFDDRASQIGLAPQHTDDTTWRYGLQAYAERVTGARTWSANLQLTRETYESEDLIRDRAGLQAERLSLDAGGQLAWFLLEDRLLLAPALRLLWLDEKASGRDGEARAWLTPQLGLRLHVGERVTLRANAARYVRPPAFFERFGDRGFVIGNPALEPERGTNLDLGGALEGEGPGPLRGWRLGLTGFYSEVRDLIAFVYDAQGVGRAVNIGRARILGIEAEAQAELAAGTRLSLNLTWQDARNRSEVAAFDDKRLPGRYRTVLNLELEQRVRRLRLYYRLRFAEGLFYDRPNLLAADTVLRHDLGAELDLGRWRLGLQVDNLSDRNFEQFNGYPTPGRAWYATLTYRFAKEE